MRKWSSHSECKTLLTNNHNPNSDIHRAAVSTYERVVSVFARLTTRLRVVLAASSAVVAGRAEAEPVVAGQPREEFS